MSKSNESPRSKPETSFLFYFTPKIGQVASVATDGFMCQGVANPNGLLVRNRGPSVWEPITIRHRQSVNYEKLEVTSNDSQDVFVRLQNNSKSADPFETNNFHCAVPQIRSSNASNTKSDRTDGLCRHELFSPSFH